METVKTLSDEELFRTLDSYPWGSDEEYQHGLQAILGPNPSEEQARHLTLRSRCFYYSRYETRIDRLKCVSYKP